MKRSDAPKSMPGNLGNTLNFVSGEVQAILAFAVILAKNYATPIVLSDFDDIEQKRIAEAEMLLVGDELLKGFQFASHRIRKALEEAAATNSGQNPK